MSDLLRLNSFLSSTICLSVAFRRIESKFTNLTFNEISSTSTSNRLELQLKRNKLIIEIDVTICKRRFTNFRIFDQN